MRLLPRALLRAGARRSSATCSACAEYGDTVRQRPSSTARSTGSVPPREVLRRGPAAAGQLRRHMRGTAKPPLAVMASIPRSTSSAATRCGWSRATSTPRRSMTRTRVRGAAAGCEAGRRALHVVDLDGARERRAGQPRAPARASRASRRPRSVWRRPAVALAAVDDALAAGAGRVILGTAAFTDPALLAGALAEARPRAGARLGGRARRARSPRPAGLQTRGAGARAFWTGCTSAE